MAYNNGNPEEKTGRQALWLYILPGLLDFTMPLPLPIGSMYGIYANIWGILMVNVTIYSIHGSYGLEVGISHCQPA